MKKLWLIAPVLLSLVCILLPDSASAQVIGQIIPTECNCPGSAPDWGCVFQTVQNLINIAISLAVIIATLVIAYAGALWILSPTNPQNIEKGRTMLLNAVIGLAVVLAAWLLVDTVMKTLYDEGASGGGVTLGPWNKIILDKPGIEDNCIVKRADPPPVTPGPDTDTPSDETPNGDKDLDGIKNSEDNDDDGDGVCDPGAATSTEHPCTGTDNCPMNANADQADNNGNDDTAGSAGDVCEEPPVSDSGVCPGSSCVDLPPDVLCVAAGCKTVAFLKTKLDAVNNAVSFAVTEAYPESRPHCAVCHTNGTCVDVGLRPANYTPETVSAFLQAASAQGLHAEFETNSQAKAAEMQAAGIEAHYYDWVTANHFSVYGPGGSGGSTGGSNGATGCAPAGG